MFVYECVQVLELFLLILTQKRLRVDVQSRN